MMSLLARIRRAILFFRELMRKVERLQIAVGRIEARFDQAGDDLSAHEFTVFSQWGEDGIIEYLVKNIEIPRPVFVEFGVENYMEANTRFLLVNRNWSGLVLDASEENIQFIRNDGVYWRYNLKAQAAFITKDNINDLIRQNGIQGPIGILSVDIDGNDYWVWDAINIVDPAIVITEYNYRFGDALAVTIPYQADFVRTRAHSSGVYYGASLAALQKLGEKKGYALVGCNSAGNNAFFVRKDLLNDRVREKSVREAYVAARFKEARDPQGSLQGLAPEEECSLIKGLPLVEIP